MAGCKRVTQKKYAKRPSPPFHANDCKGKTMEGNDGRTYRSVPDKRGVHTWKPVGSSSKKTRKGQGKGKGEGKGEGKGKRSGRQYQIHHNGGRPYIVEDFPSKKLAILYKNIVNDDTGESDETKHLMDLKYKKIWLGTPKSEAFGDWEKGNAILIQNSDNKYVIVRGAFVEEFSLRPGDSVVEFFNPIGNNDVPYPYVVGQKNVYLTLEYAVLPKEKLDLESDVYTQYYGHGQESLKQAASKLNMKTLHSIEI